MTQAVDVIVIGGGQAGLAAGYHLQRRQLSFTILDASQSTGGSWPQYYASLRLFSPAWRSSLPGMPFPPTRDEVVAYLQRYADAFQLPVMHQAVVTQVERTAEGFDVRTADGTHYSSAAVIAATGAFQRPFIPSFPGQEQFAGRIMHAATYQTPETFRGQRVIVVGAGNSAIQIAVELARHVNVTLATRGPIQFQPQHLLGLDIHFWAWATGLDWFPLNQWTARATRVGVLDTGVYAAAIAAHQPEQRPLFTRMTAEGVVWADGTQEPIDTILFATGYQPNLDYLAATGALDDQRLPLHRRGISTTVPGLAYVGLTNQSTYASATIRGVGPDAAYVVKYLARAIRPTRTAMPFFSSARRNWQCCSPRPT